MSFVLSCCSTADMTKAYFNQRDIHYLCFHYQLDGKDMLDDLGESMSLDKFYQAMVDGADTRTSQISVGEYEKYFESFLKAGKDVLHLTLSSGISGTVQSAMLAKETLDKKYPNRKLIIVDSLAASSGYGLLMDQLADLRDQGKSIDEVADWAEDHKKNVNHWFFSTDLTFFIKGGRVSKTAGMVGQLLNICPLLNVDYQGRLIARDKIRTKRKVIREIVARMEQYAENGHNYSGKVFISQSACREDAQAVADLIVEKFPRMNGKPVICDIGTTIGSHTGPGTVALFFVGEERVD